MTTMNTSAFAPLPEVVLPGKPAYLYGSMPWDTQDTLIQVTSVAISANVATVVGTIQWGNVPVAGNMISIQGTQTLSGAFNVSSIPLSSVSVVVATGVVTMTFPLVGTTTLTTADAGNALIPIAEVAETLAANTSVPVYVPSQEPNDMGSKSITTAVTFPTMPTAATVTLYSAINLPKNLPGSAGSEWTSDGVVATVAGGAFTVGPLFTEDTGANTAALAGRFFCLRVTSVTGPGTIIAKLIS
jgi:hypothetical protein